MDLLKSFALDPEKVENGVWKKVARGVELRIARINNKKYREALRAAIKTNRADLDQDDNEAMELSDELMREVFAKTIVRGLRVIPSELPPEGLLIDGVPFTEFSVDIARKLLAHDLLRDKIKKFAEDEEAFKLYGEDQAVKG